LRGLPHQNPRISVDAKKKELVGNFKNSGQSWRQEAEKVNAHDFPQDAECRASQYGIYDQERNEGHVCVATSADTADLAVDAIADWWRLDRPNYPQAKRLMIEADSGGSNASRSRRFKKGLQDFADESGLEITVCHYPPGTSKWNPIEHRLFSQITATWAGFVLSTLAVLLGFITGLTLSHQAALLAGTAFVGAYTTFSTWMLETQRLTEERQIWPAVANLVVSGAFGLPAAMLGQWIAGLL